MMGWGELRAMFWGAEWEKEGEKLGKQVKGCYQGTGGLLRELLGTYCGCQAELLAVGRH